MTFRWRIWPGDGYPVRWYHRGAWYRFKSYRWPRIALPFRRAWWRLMGRTVCQWRGHRMGWSDRLQMSRKDCWRCWDPRVAERLMPSARHPEGVWYVKGDAPWPDAPG